MHWLQQQNHLLIQALTVFQILRTYVKQFRQMPEHYSDGHNGKCAQGVIMSYFGLAGKHDSDVGTSLQHALPTLTNTALHDGFSIIELDDSDMTIDEISDYLDITSIDIVE